MVYSRPMSASGEIAGRKEFSYQSRPFAFSPKIREKAPASRGIPRNTSTEETIDQNEKLAEVVLRFNQEGRTWR